MRVIMSVLSRMSCYFALGMGWGPATMPTVPWIANDINVNLTTRRKFCWMFWTPTHGLMKGVYNLDKILCSPCHIFLPHFIPFYKQIFVPFKAEKLLNPACCQHISSTNMPIPNDCGEVLPLYRQLTTRLGQKLRWYNAEPTLFLLLKMHPIDSRIMKFIRIAWINFHYTDEF